MKVSSQKIVKVIGHDIMDNSDLLAVEEPLEIKLQFRNQDDFISRPFMVTMRTPGHDFELVTGILHSEGIISKASEINRIYYCREVEDEEEFGNVLMVRLNPDVEVSTEKFQRNLDSHSGCGVCGKSSIESLQFKIKESIPSKIHISPEFIYKLPETLRNHQVVFRHTGGLHAAGLCNERGEVIYLREDIGRHNALDKVIGAALIDDKFAISEGILVLSGRVGFELIQKALVAGIKIIVAIGAPSSLAVSLAETYDVTLIGFARKGSFNIYSGKQRVALPYEVENFL